MKKYKVTKELLTEEEVNEYYSCHYCGDSLIEDGKVRKDWYLTETQYGDYCCEKEECVWTYFGDHEGMYGEEQIDSEAFACDDCETNEVVDDGDICPDCTPEDDHVKEKQLDR